MSDQILFRPGQWVEIGGRTMLRPGFSLVGLTGIVFFQGPDVPPGCVTVAVDWKQHGYTPEKGYPLGSLPMLVNVPGNYLTAVEPPELEEEEEEPENEAPPGPGLRLV